MDLFTGGSVIMDYFGQKRCFNGFVSYVQTLHKMLIDALVCIIVMFLSAVWTFHSDGTHSLAEHPLVSNRCNVTFSQSALMKKHTHLHLDDPRGAHY